VVVYRVEVPSLPVMEGKDTKTNTDRDAVRHAAPRLCIVRSEAVRQDMDFPRQKAVDARKRAAGVGEVVR
jgi:hypothetical protein